jgi:hypothetical protein
MALGSAAGCLRYLPDVVVEHGHPLVRKGQWDAGYARVNDKAMYARDEAAFRGFCEAGGMAEAVGKVRGLRAVHA